MLTPDQEKHIKRVLAGEEIPLRSDVATLYEKYLAERGRASILAERLGNIVKEVICHAELVGYADEKTLDALNIARVPDPDENP